MYPPFENLGGMAENLRMKLSYMLNELNNIFGWGSKITECTQSFLFCGGEAESVFDIYGCCNVAHVSRISPKNTIPYIKIIMAK